MKSTTDLLRLSSVSNADIVVEIASVAVTSDAVVIVSVAVGVILSV